MRNLFLILLLFPLLLWGENIGAKDENKKPEVDIEQVIEKIDEIEKRIDEMENKLKEIEEKILKINENFNELRKAFRNMQIYIQPQASIKPTEEEWRSIKKGMYKEDVQKTLGSPEEIKKNRDGSEVWYYFGLGRVLFNFNGEVIRIEDDIYTPPTRIR